MAQTRTGWSASRAAKTITKPSSKYDYIRCATKRFLAGTGCSTPERAVTRGLRSVEEWAAVLREELERRAKLLREDMSERRDHGGQSVERISEHEARMLSRLERR